MTSATDVTELGLRERKRRATRRAIQFAVLQIVKDRGLDAVTVDEVSRIADISPRTFFNYFASKEEAVLGDPPELPAGEVTDRFASATDGKSLLDGLVAVLIMASEKSMEDAELLQLRHTLVKHYPQLAALRMAKMCSFEEQLAHLVARRLASESPNVPDAVRDDRARLITHVAFGVMRHAWGNWAKAGPSTELSELLTDSFAQLDALFARTATVSGTNLG